MRNRVVIAFKYSKVREPIPETKQQTHDSDSVSLGTKMVSVRGLQRNRTSGKFHLFI
jgi:hypothetical protein